MLNIESCGKFTKEEFIEKVALNAAYNEIDTKMISASIEGINKKIEEDMADSYTQKYYYFLREILKNRFESLNSYDKGISENNKYSNSKKMIDSIEIKFSNYRNWLSNDIFKDDIERLEREAALKKEKENKTKKEQQIEIVQNENIEKEIKSFEDYNEKSCEVVFEDGSSEIVSFEDDKFLNYVLEYSNTNNISYITLVKEIVSNANRLKEKAKNLIKSLI